MAPVRPALDAVAHTLVYDSTLCDGTSLELAASVTLPTLVISSQGSNDQLTGWAAALDQALPNSTHRSLPGAWHGVPDDSLAPVLREFFAPEARVGRGVRPD
jgi:hypothetical protein